MAETSRLNSSSELYSSVAVSRSLRNGRVASPTAAARFDGRAEADLVGEQRSSCEGETLGVFSFCAKYGLS
jgi:hypothetical protein